MKIVPDFVIPLNRSTDPLVIPSHHMRYSMAFSEARSMECDKVEGPGLPTLVDLKNHLRAEPLYFQVLEDYLHNAANLIEELRARLERNEREAHQRVEVPTADILHGASPPPSREQLVSREILQQQRDLEREYEDEGQVALHLLEHQQQMRPEDLEVEPVQTPVVSENNWEEEMEMTEWQQVPLDAVPRAPLIVQERREVEAVREIVLRSRTITFPIVEQERHAAIPASPEVFHLPAVEGLPAQFQQALVAPKIDPYTVMRNDDGSTKIECGFCPKEFGTLKGWRIHASKIHRQNGFCQKCGHFINMPHAVSAEEIAAVMELHSMEWCPKVTKAAANERTAKRRRLELVGRREEAERYFIPSASQ